MQAFRYNRVKIGKFLLNKGGCLGVDNSGNTALHYSAYCGSLESVKYLITSGVPVDIENNLG